MLRIQRFVQPEGGGRGCISTRGGLGDRGGAGSCGSTGCTGLRAGTFFALLGHDASLRYIENPGAGVKRKAAALAVDQLAALGVGRVAAGRFGPEALESLGAASIEPQLVTGMKLRHSIELLDGVKI